MFVNKVTMADRPAHSIVNIGLVGSCPPSLGFRSHERLECATKDAKISAERGAFATRLCQGHAGAFPTRLCQRLAKCLPSVRTSPASALILKFP